MNIKLTPPPFSWSYSKLSLYESCPRKYKFRYIDNIPSPKHPAAERGTNIHQGVEDYLHHKTEAMPPEVVDFEHIIAEVRTFKPQIEHKISFDMNWELTPWSGAWGKSVVDSLYLAKQAVELQEWKSGKIYNDHQDQRKLYAALGLLLHPTADKATIRTYYFDQKKLIKLELVRDDTQEIFDEFSQRVYFMTTDDEMAPRPGWYCQFCPYSRYKGGKCKLG